MSSSENNNSQYNNLQSDSSNHESNITISLSKLEKELNDNFENLIIGENSLGYYLNKRNSDKKTIYTSNRLKLDLKEINSDSTSVENILIEEKYREILFKGNDEEKEEEGETPETAETRGETKVEGEQETSNDLFDTLEQAIEKKIQKKIGKNKGDDNETGDNENNDEIKKEDNANVDENDNDDKKINSTLVQDISDYNQERIEDEEFNKLFDMLYDDETDKKETKENIEEKEKLEKEKKELEEQEKKKEILKEEYYPIDIIEEAEKYYNLNEESKEDLFPLNTYQLNNGLCINFLGYQDPNISTPIPGSVTTIGSDHANNLYICTSEGRIIKKGENEILFQNVKKQDYTAVITCIDIVDPIILTGDEKGNIAIWSNDTLSRILPNVSDNNKIICIKIVQLIGNHLTCVFSDIKGTFNFIKAHISKNNEIINDDLKYEYTPIYNILLFPNDISSIKSERESIIMFLVSAQNIGIYRLYPEGGSFEKLKIFDYIYDEKGAFTFDVSSGFGFPPASDLKKGRIGYESNAAYRGSISNNIVIGNEDEETLMLAISYGKVLLIYGLRISDESNDIKPIGFIINDKPIIRNCFVTNSMIAIVTNDFYIKLINTFDCVPKVYNQQVDKEVTKNFLISYEYLNISNKIKGDWITFPLNSEEIKKKIYNNKIIVNNKDIYYISDNDVSLQKIQKISLSNYDEVLGTLCDKEDYIRMLWLLSIITNKKTNLLNKQLNKIDKNYNDDTKKSLCDLYLMRFVIAKTIPELQKNNETYARMLLEFFIETEDFESFLKYMDLLKNYELDHYIYSNLTKYIINGSLSEIIINNVFINNYIEYCISKKEKLLLNKVLLKLNLDTLLQEEVLNIISQKELINPYIYTRIKNIKLGKIDYFLPLLYLDFIFKKEYLMKMKEEKWEEYLIPEQLELFKKQLSEKKEENDEEVEKNLNISKDYKKLITEHNIDYFNEDTFSCHEYIGHKLLWYCKKCLSGKEYPNDTQMSPNNYKETAIKMLAFLIKKENMKLYLEFDSYTYLYIISQYFFNEKLFNFIYGYERSYSQQLKEFINICLGEDADKDFSAFKVYITIKDSFKYIDVNRYFLRYDFYVLTCEICQKVRDFLFEIKDIRDALIYFSEFDLADYNEEKDLYNCHRKIKGDKDIEKFKEKIEKYMVNLLNYLKSYHLLTVDFAKELVKKRRVYGYKKVYLYLCEEVGNYREYLKLKMVEFENKNKKDLYTEKDKKELFSWIKKIDLHTKELDKQSEDSEHKDSESKEGETKESKTKDNKSKDKKPKGYNKNFKDILLENLIKLCEISIEKLSDLIDERYEEDERFEIINHLGEGQSSELQLKLLDEYLRKHQNDKYEDLEKYLDLEINILIKNRNKRRIKKLLMSYNTLCNDTISRRLEQNRMYDCCIYICQQRGMVKEGIALTIKEVKQRYKNIIEVLNRPNFNPKLIDLELKELYKYFEFGLSVCQNHFSDEVKEDKQIDNTWLDLFNTACELKIKFYPRYESNKNNNKTQQHKKIFDGLQNCIQLILETMSDYVSLNLLVATIAENCKKWKSIEFYTFIDKSLFSFRRSEYILKCTENLMTTSILIDYDKKAELKTLGTHIFLDEEKCDYCKFKLKSNNNDSYISFACGHKFHVNCCWEEKNIKVCYICRIIEIGCDNEKAKNLKEAQPAPELSYLEQEKKEKEEIKKEEREKKKKIKSKLSALQKLKKKRREIDAYLIRNDIYN